MQWYLLPGDTAELDGNSLRHFPICWKDSTHSLFKIEEVTFKPGVTPIDAVQPAIFFRFFEQMSVLC